MSDVVKVAVFRGYVTKSAWARAKWREIKRLPHQTRSAIRSWWWHWTGLASRLEREATEARKSAEFRFKQFRDASDLAYHLQFPPIEAGGALLLAADKISNESAASPCEYASQEWDTGAWNCDAERRDEICWCAVASELRDLEKALRECAPFNANVIANHLKEQPNAR
jgi:hypothetical protein